MARKVTIPGQNVPIQIGGAVNPDWYENSNSWRRCSRSRMLTLRR